MKLFISGARSIALHYSQLWSSLLAAGVVIALLATVTTHAAVIGPTVVALSGTAAPAGGNYSSFSELPVLDGSGKVAFLANLTGGSSPSGIFIGVPGSVQAAALENTAAPAGGNYAHFDTPLSLNGSGQVAFRAELTGELPRGGIFAGAAGSVQGVAVHRSAAPTGGTYSNGFSGPVINNSGQVAFSASGGSFLRGIFVGAFGSVQAVALQPTSPPPGVNYYGFDAPLLNGAGQVAFRADLNDTSHGTFSEGLFVGVPGSVQTVALLETPSPAGGVYESFGFFSLTLNDSGQVAFRASLDGASSGVGIFAGTPGSIQAVALSGTASPAGGNYQSFTNPVLNALGQIAFRANLTGASSTAAIFAGAPGSLQPIVMRGTASPDGVGNLNDVGGSFAFNASGQVAFTCDLTGAGVTTANNRGLYAVGAGNLLKIVRKGDVIDVDPSALVDLRTVNGVTTIRYSGGQDGLGMGLNDSGLIVYRLTFVGGSSGIFTSQIVAVPEPAALALLAVATAGMLLGWRSKQFSRRSQT